MHKRLYSDWHFAPARVEGDLVFVSGFVAGAREGKPLDTAGFEDALRRAFGQIVGLLEAAGSGGDCIVDLFTFHVFGSPTFTCSKAEHISIVRRRLSTTP